MDLVNPVPAEECDAWLRTLFTALLGDPFADDFGTRTARWREGWRPERTWGARDRGRWVATLTTDPIPVTVPGPHGTGVDVGADALTGVSVAATHRRRGLLRDMLTRSLTAAHERGDVLATLIAAEWPIYGRFGYGPAAYSASYTYHPRAPGAGLVGARPDPVRQVEPDELFTHAPTLFAAARQQRAGQMGRPDPWWAHRLAQQGRPARVGSRGTWVVHEGPDGRPDGMLMWRATRDFELDGRLGRIEVSDLVATTDAAYRALWGYLSGIDAVSEVVLHDRPVDEPVRHLLGDARALRLDAIIDFLWVRLLDVPRALSARAYGGAARLVLDVVDTAVGGYGAGRVALETDDTGTARCTVTRDDPDLTITASALSSVYLGGTSARSLVPAGLVVAHTDTALTRTDALFRTGLAPWNQTGF